MNHSEKAPRVEIIPTANNNAVRILAPMSSADRKGYPLATGVLDYFPDALALVARVSKIGNDKHNPGQPLHWARGKSNDQADCIMRHLMERGTVDADGIPHVGYLAWRSLALAQTEIEELVARAAEDDEFAHTVLTGLGYPLLRF